MSSELDEIWALYADDGGQSLDAVEQSLLCLKEVPASAAHVAALFRAVHTFKGNARVLGLRSIEKCSHAAEDLIGLVRDENVPLDPDLVSLLLETSDILRGMMNQSLARRADVPPELAEELICRIQSRIAECRVAAQEQPEAIVFEPVEREVLSQDPLYLEIFTGMAEDTLKEARAALTQWGSGQPADGGTLASSLEHLRFAAGQIGLRALADLIGDYLSRSAPGASDLEVLIVGMDSLTHGDKRLEMPANTKEPTPPLSTETALAASAVCETSCAAGEPGFTADEFRDLAEFGAWSSEGSTLAADPTYRAIFLGMVHDILAEMEAALAEWEAGPQRARRPLTSHVDRLVHAAKQIGMPDWQELLVEFPRDRDISLAEAQTFAGKIQSLAGRDATANAAAAALGDAAEGASVREFFDSLPPLLASISTFGTLLAAGRPVDEAAFVAAVGEARSMAAALGFVRIADIAGQMGVQRQFAAFRRLELRLYEELVSIEQAMPSQVQGTKLVPAAVLQNWCAEQAFDTLIELSKVLEEMRMHGGGAAQCEVAIELLRVVYHACRHYAMKTAAHLSMSLIDLFARVRDDEASPDPILLRISGSFSACLELLFDAAGVGETPDMAAIEQLFEEAANVTFTASGTTSSSIMEARLGLPKSFRKVLTPESLKTAADAVNRGEQFYIVRAGLNNDEQASERFLEWVNSGAVSVISNVTVFDGPSTEFDFLIATSLGETQLAESLAALDATGKSLRLEMALNGNEHLRGCRQGASVSAGTEAGSAARTIGGQDLMTRDVLEGIGEIVTGQAMIYRTLGDIAAENLLRTVEAEILKAGGDWSKAKGAVRMLLEGFSGRIEKVYQAEAQLGTQLERLQEEAIAVRARPATLLTKPLEAFAEATARQSGRQIRFAAGGEDLVLDHDMLEELKPHLRTLIAFCVTQSIEPPEQRVSLGKDRRGQLRFGLTRNGERILATLEDDGRGLQAIPGGEAGDLFAETRSALRSRGGELLIDEPPGGGVRFQVILPMAMVVLDGMVVRAGEYRYVVPLDAIQRIVHSGFEDVMRLSASEGRHMLKLGAGDVLPVHFLRVDAEGSFQEQNAAAGQRCLFVVVGKQSQRVALMVDELMGQQLVLIRPLRGYLTGIRGVTGCALLGGGDVGMVLDIGGLLNQAA